MTIDLEDRVADLLERRANKLSVTPDPLPFSDELAAAPRVATSVSKIEQGSRRGWIAAAAAVLVVLAGGWWTTRSQSPVVEPAAGGDAATEVVASEWEWIVWMDPTATDRQIDDVRMWLAAHQSLNEIRFVDQEETYQEFAEFWADDPEVIDAVTPEELPLSFRGTMSSNDTSFRAEAEARPGVLKVDQADPERSGDLGIPIDSTAGPLFLLPPANFEPFGPASFRVEQQGPTDFRAALFAREVATGFDSIVLVHFEPNSVSRESGTDVEIAGRQLTQTQGQFIEQVDGGLLSYWTEAEPASLEEVVAAIRVVDGQVTVEPSELRDRSLIDIYEQATSGAVSFNMSSPENEHDSTSPGERDSSSQLLSVMSVPWLNGETDALLLASGADRLDATVVNGRVGYFVRHKSDRPSGPGIVELVWTEPSGHLVYLVISGTSDSEAIAFAESLRTVDETTWNAELSELADN